MSKKISPPPRKLSLLNKLFVFNSHVYSDGGWLATGFGSFVIWLGYTLGRPDAPDGSIVETSFLGTLVFYLVGAAFMFLGVLSLRNFVFREGWQKLELLQHGEAAYGKWIKTVDENTERVAKMLGTGDILSGTVARDAENKKLAEKMLDAHRHPTQKTRPMNSHFVFESQDGRTHKVIAMTMLKDVFLMKDEAEELILYDPVSPELAVVYDAITDAPEILPDGSLGQIPNVRKHVLILPVVVFLINLGFFLYHFVFY